MDSQESTDGHELGRLEVPSGPAAPHAARLALAQWFGAILPKRILDDAQLLISELVTNSVRHADAPPGVPITITARSTGPAIVFTVGDSGHARRIVRGVPHRDGGVGLNLVHVVAAQWGVRHDAGTEVWFELARDSREDGGGRIRTCEG